MKGKHLVAKGEADYDYDSDILFFKVSERDYVKSIELNKIVIDIDKEDFIVGIQIFDASEFLNLTKNALLKIARWQFNATVEDNKMEIRLVFQVVVRNQIIEKNPIIMQPIKQTLPDSELICKVR